MLTENLMISANNQNVFQNSTNENMEIINKKLLEREENYNEESVGFKK